MGLISMVGPHWSLTSSICLVLILFFCLYKYATKDFNYWQIKGISFIKPTPFIGNLMDVVTFKRALGPKLADIYFQSEEPVVGIWCFGVPTLIIRSPELISQMLCKDFNYFCDRAVTIDKSVDPLANSLFVLKYSDWKSIRHKMTPVFSSAKLKAMTPLLQENANSMLNHLDHVPDGNVEAKELFTKYTIDAITSCVFGVQANAFIDENSPFTDIGRKAFEGSIMNAIRAITYFFLPDVAALFKIRFLDGKIMNFFQNSFLQTVKARKSSNVKRNDLVDILIALQNETTDGIVPDDVTLLSQLVTFFLAGFETASAIMAFTFYELSLNEKIQDTLREEINSTLLKHKSFTYDAMSEMRYLEKVVSETLRKYPPLPFIDRRCVKEYKLPDSDVVIDVGTTVLVPTLGIHHDPKIYPEPEKFDPERFSEGNLGNISGSNISFGVGPRACIGERFGICMINLGLAEVISKYQVKRIAQTPVPLVFHKKSLVLAASDGIPLRLVKIE